MATHTLSSAATRDLNSRAVRALARSMVRNMQAAGYSHGQVVELATALLDLVGESFRESTTAA